MTLEQIRQKIEEEQAQETQRVAEIESARGTIANLEEQIDNAVDNGNLKEAERLEEQRQRERIHLDILQRYNARRLDPERYKGELREICADKAAELQPVADKMAAEVLKLQKQLLEKKIALVRCLSDAASFRIECASLAGVGALESGSQLDDFAAVAFNNMLTEIGNWEQALVLGMDPQFYTMRNNARNYLQFKVV